MAFALFTATKCGDAKKVDQLLSQSPDNLFYIDYRGRSALHLAVEHGHYNVVETLIGHGIYLAQQDRAGFTALHVAAELGHDVIVTRLLLANPKELLRCDWTCLRLAIINGHAIIVRRLLTANIELLKANDKNDGSALFLAVEHGQEEVVAVLVESVKSKLGFADYLFFKALGDRYDHIANQILDQNPHLVATVEAAMSALYVAAYFGSAAVVKQLLAAKPHLLDVACDSKIVSDLVTKNGFNAIIPVTERFSSSHRGMSILHFAASVGHEEVVTEMLAVKPTLATQQDTEGRTALHLAAENGQTKIVDALLTHWPELNNVRKWNGETAVHSALDWCQDQDLGLQDEEKPVDEGMVKLMLTRNPELARNNVVDCCGNTILHRVFEYRERTRFVLFSEDLMRMVWEMNPAALRVANLEGKTPLDVAVEHFNDFAIELVRPKRGRPANNKNGSGENKRGRK